MNSYDLGRVVSFTLNDKKTKVTVMEECDRYYKEELDQAEFQKFINKLQKLCDQMKDDVTFDKDKNGKVIVKKGNKTIAMQG